MTNAVQIETLTGRDHLAPLLAAWHHQEWGHLYTADVWNLATAVGEFEAMAEPGSSDRTWVAFDGDARDADAVLGSVSLLATDDLGHHEHLTPWLASMFVTEAARGRGVATALMNAVLAGARADGHDVVYLFTSGQQQFWAERGWSVVDNVDAAGHPATVMARSTHPRAARRAVSSQWCTDPDHGGAYSHLRVGGTPAHRERLADEIVPGLWFAGEATSAAYPATMHGAFLSGERAAAQVLADPARARVAVIGAGLSGLAAARALRAAGRDPSGVVVLESKAVVGGRIVVDRSLGMPLPMGGAWLHGDEGHPLRDLVTSVPEDWDHPVFFAAACNAADGVPDDSTRRGRLSDDDAAAVAAAFEQLQEAFEAADPTVSVADVVAATIAASAWSPTVRDALVSWITSECEGLYGAPMHDVAANGGFEPYELPGGDHLITSDLGALAARLADGLDVHHGHRVSDLRHDGEHWVIDHDLVVDAVIVTLPIAALGAGRITVTPELPADVQTAIASIGAGPITKVFVTFDEAWWPAGRIFRFAGTDTIQTIMDVTPAAGRPTLLGFAVGDAAPRVERLGEHELCRLFDHEFTAVGFVDWDTPPA